MDINSLRADIDAVDSDLLDAFCRRMEISAKVAACKKENGLPVFDPARERQKLNDVANRTPEALRTHAAAPLFHALRSLPVPIRRSS